MNRRYVIGLDFGTESGRAVLVDAASGEELASHVTPYAYGVIDRELPGSGRRLEPDWALQHPGDYLDVLKGSVPEVVRLAGAKPEEVIGIGIAFTSCTMLPVDSDGTPLCMLDAYRAEPHAYVKLWKHHAAQEEADLINQIALDRCEPFMARYGESSSSEWMLAKSWQLLNEAPRLYAAADRLVEAADWLVYQLTGMHVRNSCSAGYKSFWHKEDGFPSPSFLQALDPRLASLPETKLRGPVLPSGTKAGELNAQAAAWMGLVPGIAVAVPTIDAHAGVPGSGATRPGQLVMAMGTSLCHMLLSDREVAVRGISGVVEDGIIPGLYGYEAGQPAAGDLFGWFAKQFASREAAAAAEREGMSLHAWLEHEAARQLPGQHGLLALDWWNGNRSVLNNADLSGLVVGMTLQTQPEDLYRALLEATAYGTRKVIETFEQAGLPVTELFACGGLPHRNRLLMQLFADITGREIRVAASEQTTALGAAMFGAAAAGAERGGCGTVAEAVERMAPKAGFTFRPIPENTAVYDELYREYNHLHELFGADGGRMMGTLKALKRRQEAAAGETVAAEGKS